MLRGQLPVIVTVLIKLKSVDGSISDSINKKRADLYK
jgi:hypothetical protein